MEREDIPCLPIDLRGLPRKLGPEIFRFAGRLVGSIRDLTRAVSDFSPSHALGMGGYLSFPLMLAAWRGGVSRSLHESNSILGLANAASLKLGAKLFWGLPPAPGEPAGTLVGTPTRVEFSRSGDVHAARERLGLQKDLPTLLVFGGSQGARALNEYFPTIAPTLGAAQIFHVAGRGKGDAVRANYQKIGARAIVADYCDDMPSAYAAADLVVCRSGASTLAELAALKKPAILIPYPHATAQHQDFNARVFEVVGAAARVPENDLPKKFPEQLKTLFLNKSSDESRSRMSRSYAALGLPAAGQSAAKLADALEAQ